MDVTLSDLLYRFGVALVIGPFMGLQREYAFRRDRTGEAELMAGARTFAIIALLGAAAGMVSDRLESAWPFVGALVGVTLLLAVAHFWQTQERDVGLTTEMSALIALFAGGLCFWGELRLAAALGVGTAVLLSLKVQTHTLARRLDPEDVYATLKFAVITVIVLPLLPRQGYGPFPFDALVPYNVWLMVVLISGISFLGYVLIKAIGPRRGVGLTGLLGGLASSTAVTLSVAERSRSAPGLAHPFALALILAWTIMFIRVLVEVAVVHPPLLWTLWPPILGVMATGVAFGVYLYQSEEGRDGEEPETVQNPFRLAPALTFGLLYAVILVVTNGAQRYFGDAGVYGSSLVAGLADVDAITLSMARLQEGNEVSPTVATRAIVIAAAANTLLKGGIVMATGGHDLRRVLLPGLLLMLAASGLAVVLI